MKNKLENNKLDELLNAKNIQIVKASRNQPLAQCGLIISHYINVNGLSHEEAKKYLADIINEQKDNDISKHFQFYKQYWLTITTGESRIEVNLI